ncbi:hypothetical protein HQQ80_00710 [Microbacteriaceae bacterium VKM Ac-2855]|nr:hypothetical protein [Microbacteriaceae bacterium VKM Ac-2855]
MEVLLRRSGWVLVAAVALTTSGCTGGEPAAPSPSIPTSPTASAAPAWSRPNVAPSPLPTTTDAAVVNNTACLDYYALTDRWYDSGDLVQYAIDLRAVVPQADEFMAGQLTSFANALDGIPSDVPIGQAEAIAGMQIDRVCAEAGVPAPVGESYTY